MATKKHRMSRVERSESRQDFRSCFQGRLPKLLASFATSDTAAETPGEFRYMKGQLRI